MQLGLLLAALPWAMAGPTAKRSEPAPLIMAHLNNKAALADRYIVKFRVGSKMDSVHDAIGQMDGDAQHIFEYVFPGFAGALNDSAINYLRNLPDVDFIEQDSIGSISGFVTQNGSTWGLGRISHRNKGVLDYTLDNTDGQGVCAYVVDTGVDDTHPEFEGRASMIKSFVAGSNVDDNNHGTHCSGTLGSKTYGVAKKVVIYGIKVLAADGNGPWSQIIAGMEYVAQDVATRSCPYGVVVSISIGGGFTQAANDAARALTQRGYFVAIASGNNNAETSQFSPGSEPSVCTVGGSDINDARYTGSNFGPLVDIVGPAVDVLSTIPGNRTDTFTGTSMATPHIAGLAAYLAALDGVEASPALCQRIVEMATKNAITDQSPNTVNLIAFNGNPLG